MSFDGIEQSALAQEFLRRRRVRTTLEHGNATESAMGYVLFGVALLGRGELDAAFEFGQLGCS